MDAIEWIIERFNWLAEYLYKAYREILDLPWPFWMAAWPFYLASEAVSQIAWGFLWLYYYLEMFELNILRILSWEQIWSILTSWLPHLIAVNAWFYNWRAHITQVITEWWSTITTVFETLINEVKQWAKLWIDWLDTRVNELRADVNNLIAQIPDVTEIMAWFSNWTGNVSSVIDTWWTGALANVQSLINSAFIVREPFWAGWQDWRDKVTEFFSDPEDWLYKSVDRIIERYW